MYECGNDIVILGLGQSQLNGLMRLVRLQLIAAEKPVPNR
jgi:hypothetical protein